MKLKLLHKLYYAILNGKEKRKQKKWLASLKNHSVLGLANCYVSYDSCFGGKNSVGPNSYIKSSEIGYATYIGTDCYFKKTVIGKFCSIANNVRIIGGNHPSSVWVSTHPAFYSKMMKERFGYTEEQLYDEFKYADDEKKKFVCIGCDVWIGAEVSIMEGVTIGDGAIIASKAMVTKDVAPYEIVGGVPAKHIKWRFDENDREYLLKLQWWDKPEEWIRKNAALFSDIRKMREKNVE